MLLDAPCSATGTYRRHPDVLWAARPSDVAALAGVQSRLLDSAARRVKPGGRLVYVTCSMLARENEASADAFEAANPDFRPVAVADVLSAPQLSEAARAKFAELASGARQRLSPASADTDGFFAAVYERTA